MKQFNLEEYLANPSKKVVTRDGRSVRICCTDRKSEEQPIVALIASLTEDSEYVGTYRKDGIWSTSGCASELDLFFAPEKHEKWINLYKWDNSTRYYVSKPFDSEEEAMEFSRKDDNYLKTLKIEWEE